MAPNVLTLCNGGADGGPGRGVGAVLHSEPIRPVGSDRGRRQFAWNVQEARELGRGVELPFPR